MFDVGARVTWAVPHDALLCHVVPCCIMLFTSMSQALGSVPL